MSPTSARTADAGPEASAARAAPRPRRHVPPLIYTSDSTFPRDRRFVGRLVEALDAALKTDAVSQHGGVPWLSPTS